MSFITAEGIIKDFKSTRALDDINLEIPEGKIFGLLGPNGAGKTTFIRILNQILSADAGKIRINGNLIEQSDIARIGYLPEERGLYKKMKVGEQALYFATLKGMHKAEAKRELQKWFEKFEIAEWWDKKVEELSKGMQQKVQFITTVLHKPEILILDEPFSGFDPVNAESIKQEILTLNKEGTTILLSTHNMSSVEELCDNIALFNKAKKILQGSVTDVRNSFKTNEYLITFEGYFDQIVAGMTTSYKILEQTKENDITKLRLKLTEDGVISNDLLKHLMGAGNIVNYKEILPSMNDIFIQAVSENSKAVEDE